MRDVSRETGISYTTLMFYQRSGFENAPFGRVLAIARYLGCRPEDLITEEEDQKHEIEH
ncbi:MAG: helix-turn-helix transcriptional regulator [Enterococcus faecium]|nr:helix-turn-helix transcriptional regulator [Enterococcus faecium]